MNAAQRRAVEAAISNLEDDLYRYKRSEEYEPGRRTGNGALYTEVIANHEKRIAELKEGL